MILVHAGGEGLLGACLKLAHPYGIGEHCLGCVHAGAVAADAAQVDVLGHGTCLRGRGIYGIVGSVVVQINIHAQFFAHDAVIVDVGAQIGHWSGAHIVVRNCVKVIDQCSVFIDFSCNPGGCMVLQVPSPFHFAAKEVIIGQLPVYAGVSVEALSEVLTVYCAVVLEHGRHSVFDGIACCVGVAKLAVSVALIVQASEEIHSAGAIVHVEGAAGVISLRPAEALLVGGVHAEAEAVALPADGLDAHHAANSGVVLRSGIGDNLNALNLITLQAVQLAGISNLSTIDVHQRGSFADNLQAVLALDQAGCLGQDVVCRSNILQHGAPDAGLQALPRKFDLGHYGRRHGALQHGGVFVEGDYGTIDRYNIYGLIAQHGNHHDAVGLSGYDIESAVLCGHSAAHYGAVGLGKYGHVGIRHGIAVFVHHLAGPIVFTLCKH